MEEKKMGRPTEMTEDRVRKLEIGFARGYNDTECCKYADISRDTYYRWIRENEDFSDRMELAKCDLNIKAKNNIADEIEKGNIEISKWHLERRARDEYSVKQNVTADLSGDVVVVVDLIDE